MRMQAHVGALAGALRHLAQEQEVAAGAAHADKVERQRRAKTHFGLARERVVRRHHQDQLVARVAHRAHPRRVVAGVEIPGQDADIGLMRRHRGQDSLAGTLLQVDVDVGVGQQEAAQAGNNEAVERAAVGQQPDIALQPGREAPDLAMHALHAQQQFAHMDQQGFARRGQLHAARAAHEQRRAHGVLQVLQAVARRRRGDVSGRRAARQALRIGNGLEQAQVGQFVTQGNSIRAAAVETVGAARALSPAILVHPWRRSRSRPTRRLAQLMWTPSIFFAKVLWTAYTKVRAIAGAPVGGLRFLASKPAPHAEIPAAPRAAPSQELSCKSSPICFSKAVAMKRSSSTSRPLAPRSTPA
ncbi:protein of unknown function (plasmid) [Cupriavidus taiwanensis]|uniref:Uncharacterized protein n=1 Tax=Cupriavidus taiwanensis TaxID=164546 RepID=A0A375IP19_9BURK|nr:protein of unknown function [Cupriavidus taiwanensis]